MALTKDRINIIFASIVGLLLVLAAAFSYLNSKGPVIREAAALDPTVGQLPENHPPIDGASRLSLLEQMSRQNPQNAEYKTQIGNTYYDLGQYEKAINAYQESLNLQPNDPNVETDLATCFYYLGQPDEALRRLDAVLTYSPGFPQAMFNKGIVLIDGKNDVKNGIAVWEALLQSNSDLPRRTELEQKVLQLKSTLK